MTGWLLTLVLGILGWAYNLLLGANGLHAIEALVQAVWSLLFNTRPLSAEELAAAREIFPPGMIPYHRVRVCENSLLCRWSDAAGVTTMYIVHCPAQGMPLPIVVHELAHCAQYRAVGLVYIPQALHAQHWGGGYDYADLASARLAGRRFRHFNREQQAQLCEDYYRDRHRQPSRFGGSLADLQPFITDMHRGDF